MWIVIDWRPRASHNAISLVVALFSGKNGREIPKYGSGASSLLVSIRSSANSCSAFSVTAQCHLSNLPEFLNSTVELILTIVH